jgi:hypothetical protein
MNLIEAITNAYEKNRYAFPITIVTNERRTETFKYAIYGIFKDVESEPIWMQFAIDFYNCIPIQTLYKLSMGDMLCSDWEITNAIPKIVYVRGFGLQTAWIKTDEFVKLVDRTT